jgi:hypothetical protein
MRSKRPGLHTGPTASRGLEEEQHQFYNIRHLQHHARQLIADQKHSFILPAVWATVGWR